MIATAPPSSQCQGSLICQKDGLIFNALLYKMFCMLSLSSKVKRRESGLKSRKVLEMLVGPQLSVLVSTPAPTCLSLKAGLCSPPCAHSQERCTTTSSVSQPHTHSWTNESCVGHFSPNSLATGDLLAQGLLQLQPLRDPICLWKIPCLHGVSF